MFSADQGVNASTPAPYSDDVFNVSRFVGTGASLNIVNGLNLAASGGMVLFKRTDTATANDFFVHDTTRSPTTRWLLNTTGAPASAANSVTSFNSDGFTVGATFPSASLWICYTFLRHPRFFDIVTYTGNGSSQTINTNLSVPLGMVIIKRNDTGQNNILYARTLSAGSYLTTNATTGTTTDANTFTSTLTGPSFTVGSSSLVNANTVSYTAYCFAHDTASNGIIEVLDASATINYGWEPQFIFTKPSSAGMAKVFSHNMLFGMQTLQPQYLPCNGTAVPQLAGTDNYFRPTPTGLVTSNMPAGPTLGIRIRNKPASSMDDYLRVSQRTGTGNDANWSGMGYMPDLFFAKILSGSTGSALRMMATEGDNYGDLGTGNLQSSSAQFRGFSTDGVLLGGNALLNGNGYVYVGYGFRRRPGFMDIVTFVPNGTNVTVPHSLGVAPELIIAFHGASATGIRTAMYTGFTDYYHEFNNLKANQDIDVWQNAAPTSTSVFLGPSNAINRTATACALVLFATLPGVSKCGTYTGTGSATPFTVDCGFTSGARFVMIFRRDTSGTNYDIYVFDSTRGIVAGNDPYFVMDAASTQVTTQDWIDPVSSGFQVATSDTLINASGVTFFYLAVAA